ncbi:MAG: SDR family oxidoreductase [Bacilli bacterium]
MRVAVTGSSGLLGTAVMKTLVARNMHPVSLSLRDLLTLNEHEVVARFHEAKADCLIHCAALSDVDWCESHPDEAFDVNARGTTVLAEACRKTNTRMCAISTDYVFDGTLDRSYVETDAPRPINAYGKTKWIAEQGVLSHVEKGFFVVRTSWLFGDSRTDFFGRVVSRLRNGETVCLSDEQRSRPTYTAHLAAAICDLLESPSAQGIFHLVNSTGMSRFAQAKAVLDTLGLGTDQLLGVGANQEVPRPKHTELASVRTASFGIIMPDFATALGEYLAEPRQMIIRE